MICDAKWFLIGFFLLNCEVKSFLLILIVRNSMVLNHLICDLKGLNVSLLILINEVMSLWFLIDLWIWEFSSSLFNWILVFPIGWELKNFLLFDLWRDFLLIWFVKSLMNLLLSLIWEFQSLKIFLLNLNFWICWKLWISLHEKCGNWIVMWYVCMIWPWGPYDMKMGV